VRRLSAKMIGTSLGGTLKLINRAVSLPFQAHQATRAQVS
jgi:hypothetical protein